jgi:hypothetical protein
MLSGVVILAASDNSHVIYRIDSVQGPNARFVELEGFP